MKRYLLFSFALLTFVPAFSQRYADKWYFGGKAALDFSGGPPVVLTNSQMNAGEGSSSVADSLTGALQFYTDGLSVWNKNHVVMPNGTGLYGGLSSTQAALIVPNPGNGNQFYIITTDQIGGSLGLRASMVDMTLDGGNGDVTLKNYLVKTPVVEKVAAVKQPGSPNIWVVSHGWGNDAFYAFRITPAGVDSAVVSNVGIVHENDVIQNSYGQMKFNPCGDKIALAAGYLDKVEIFDFNTTTGVVSNPKTISYTEHVYGLEFSENGDVLYVSTYDPSASLIQYDLTISSVASMIASATILSNVSDIYPLQRASNQKIYVCKSFGQFLGVINSPNTVGMGANYVDMGVDLDPGFMGINSGLGLPNFVASYMGGTQFCTSPGTSVAENHIGTINNVFPNPSSGDFIFSAGSENILVTVTDMSGKQLDIFSNVLSGSTFRFGKDYPSGIYLVNATDASGQTSVLKLVKTF